MMPPMPTPPRPSAQAAQPVQPPPASSPQATYTQRLSEARAEVNRCESRARVLGLLRLLCFFLTLAAATAAYDGWPEGVNSSLLWAISGAALVAFVVLVLRHDAVLQMRDRAAHRAQVNQQGLRRLDGSWAKQPLLTGASALKLEPRPQYATDLDLSGPGSLLHLLEAARTPFGDQALYASLNRAMAPSARVEEAMSRRDAVRELVTKLPLRQELEVSAQKLRAGNRPPPNPEPFLRWAEGSEALSRGWSLVRLLPLITVPLLALHTLMPALKLGPWALGLVLVQVAVMLATGMRINNLVNILSLREQGVAAYSEMLSQLAQEPLQAPDNLALQAQLRQDGLDAAAQLRVLHDLCGYLELRRHPLLWLPVNGLLLWDLHFAIRIARWQQQVGPAVRRWLLTLGEFEARATLATLGFDNPDWAWPELKAGPPLLTTVGLAHPLLLQSRRVGNDITLPGAGRAWLVTGSNMSGKSTMLRSIGLLQVLAHAGAPVCAQAATLSPLRLRTVMRVDDNVLSGVSHFYAELLRLKETMDAAQEEGAPLCYLLDEILHGTNTRERELGARLCIKTLCQRGAMGAVSTHDLSLASLEAETQGAVHNVHFSETVTAEAMTFDYRLQEGPVQTTNALRLMRQLGIQLDWQLEPEATSMTPEPVTPTST
jgi:hypothetical protein